MKIGSKNSRQMQVQPSVTKQASHTAPIYSSSERNAWKGGVSPAKKIDRPTVLMVGNSHLKYVNTRALSNRCEIIKLEAPTIIQAREQIMKYNGPRPQCVVVQEITNEAKSPGNPKVIVSQCVDDYESTMDVIQNRWPETETIIGLSPPRGDSDRAANIQSSINAQLRLMDRGTLINFDEFGDNGYPIHDFYADPIHLNKKGVSRFASKLKRYIHTAIGIN
jgi:hypothetical protein